MSGYNTGTGYTGTGAGMGARTAQNPVTGETNVHSTQTGAAVDQGWQDLKTKVPGTTEYRATHPTTMGTTGAGAASGYGPGYTESGTTAAGYKEPGYTGTTGTTGYSQGDYPATTGAGMGAGMGTGMGTDMGTTGAHMVQNPATGERTEHRTQTGAAVHQAWQDMKEAMPGTKEHQATHPSTARRV